MSTYEIPTPKIARLAVIRNKKMRIDSDLISLRKLVAKRIDAATETSIEVYANNPALHFLPEAIDLLTKELVKLGYKAKADLKDTSENYGRITIDWSIDYVE